MRHSLTRRSLELLQLTAEHTGCHGGAFFIPSAYPMWCEALKLHLCVSGAGDAAAFRSLERRGLIVRPETTGLEYMKYIYRITDAGLAAIAKAEGGV